MLDQEQNARTEKGLHGLVKLVLDFTAVACHGGRDMLPWSVSTSLIRPRESAGIFAINISMVEWYNSHLAYIYSEFNCYNERFERWLRVDM